MRGLTGAYTKQKILQRQLVGTDPIAEASRSPHEREALCAAVEDLAASADEATVADTICATEFPAALESQPVDPPTLAMTFSVNDSPLAGTEGDKVTGRMIRDRLLRVTLPAAAPQIFAGMRTSLSLALILMVISEMVASTNGIGFFVLQSQRSFAIPEMWAGILLLGLLGYALNLIFMLVERRVLAWHRGARASALS